MSIISAHRVTPILWISWETRQLYTDTGSVQRDFTPVDKR